MADTSTPNFFSSGIPTLNQSMIDKLYKNARTNNLTANNSDIRDQIYKAGWKQKSDAVNVLNGAAIYGLVKAPEGMGGTGYKSLTGGVAGDQEFINAAKNAGIDPSKYYTKQPIGPMGSSQNALNKNALFAALQEKGKDLYSVTNAVEGSKRGALSQHATVLYKADGSGNLVPINNEQTGQPDVQYFNAVRYAKDPGIMSDLAPFLMLAPAVGGILSAAGNVAAGAGSAAGAGAGTAAGAAAGAAPSIGTLGLGAGAGLGTGTMAGTMLGGTGATLGSTAALGAGSLAALNGTTGALPSGGGLDSGKYGSVGTEGQTAVKDWSAIDEAVGAGTMPKGITAPDVAEFIETGKGLLSPQGLPYDPFAPGYQVGPEGPAKIGSQCLAFKSSSGLLDTAKNVLDTGKKVKNLFDAGKSLFGGDKPVQNDAAGLSGVAGFLCGESEFLNKMRPSSRTAGLKTVNEEAEKNVESLDFDEGDTKGYGKGGSSRTTERSSQGSLEDRLSELNEIYDKNNYVCWEKLTKPKFVCDVPEFLYVNKQHTFNNPLKPLRQGLKVNPLAAGGLPHKYAAAAPKGHKPEFITGMTGYYACGGGTGQSDDIAAMLHDGDYVMDAETVSALGDGSSKAGRNVLESFREQIPHKKEGGGNPVPAKIADGEYVFPEAFVTALGGGDNKRGAEILDGLRTKLRAHKRGAPLDKIPPKAKDPIEYIKTGSKQHG
jgi:hypothetical protein